MSALVEIWVLHALTETAAHVFRHTDFLQQDQGRYVRSPGCSGNRWNSGALPCYNHRNLRSELESHLSKVYLHVLNLQMSHCRVIPQDCVHMLIFSISSLLTRTLLNPAPSFVRLVIEAQIAIFSRSVGSEVESSPEASQVDAHSHFAGLVSVQCRDICTPDS